MKYIEIPVYKSKIFLTEEEISKLLRKDMELYKLGLKRGKAFIRSKQQREREERKYNAESKY
ncbi:MULTISPECIES: hypothetical protein [Ornithinibacillus]|uniref:hypothetical protein n=1 Tax=Ornithinibacillus TaxID=484508 RepID=UPI00064D879F|nr:hypothetical protein [Ornithinibacillus contaminans]